MRFDGESSKLFNRTCVPILQNSWTILMGMILGEDTVKEWKLWSDVWDMMDHAECEQIIFADCVCWKVQHFCCLTSIVTDLKTWTAIDGSAYDYKCSVNMESVMVSQYNSFVISLLMLLIWKFGQSIEAHMTTNVVWICSLS